MPERPEHEPLATLLRRVDGRLLRDLRCWFGDGTALTLRFGEYRVSKDLDFFVSERSCFNAIRDIVLRKGIGGLFCRDEKELKKRDPLIRRDSIKISVLIEEQQVKVEFLFDPEIQTTPDVDVSLFGLTPMSLQDAYLLKLLANANRWADESTFLRDMIDIIILESRAPDKIHKQKNLCRALSFYQNHVVVGLQQAARRLPDHETRARVAARLGLTPSAIAAIEAWRPSGTIKLDHATTGAGVVLDVTDASRRSE